MRNLHGRAVDRLRAQTAVALDQKSIRQVPAIRVELKLNHRHRRHRRQVVGIKNAEQRVGQFGKLIVDLVMHASGEQGERLDQPFHVRVGAAVGLQQQSAGGGRVLLGKLLGQLADEEQFAFVVAEEGFAHDWKKAASEKSKCRTCRWSYSCPLRLCRIVPTIDLLATLVDCAAYSVGLTEYCPDVNSRMVSKATSGEGSTDSRASTRKRMVGILVSPVFTRVTRMSVKRGSKRVMMVAMSRPMSVALLRRDCLERR